MADPKVGKDIGVPAELKPCPFCGEPVHLDAAYSYFRINTIYCENCDCVFTLDAFNATEKQIIEAWNRRVNND